MQNNLVDAEVAAPLLGLKKAALYDAVREQIVPAVHIGRRVRFDLNVLEDWIRCGGCKQLPSDAEQIEETVGNSPNKRKKHGACPPNRAKSRP